jgi:7,8-dihydro-6-hydroxymethylpterin-pyrophosphokinase
LTASALLKKLLSIEEKMGRTRTFKNAPRIIDLDILFYGNEIIDTTDVTVPHTFLAKRKFVLAPLAEIAPNLIHPVILKPVAQMLQECTDPLKVYKLDQAVHSELSV